MMNATDALARASQASHEIISTRPITQEGLYKATTLAGKKSDRRSTTAQLRNIPIKQVTSLKRGSQHRQEFISV